MASNRRYFRMRRKQISAHFAILLFTILFFISAVVLVGAYTVFNGPSQTLSDTVIRSMSQTSALKFIPYLFMSEQAVEASMARTTPTELEITTDTSLYTFNPSKSAGAYSEYVAGSSAMSVVSEDHLTESKSDHENAADDPYGAGPGITIERIIGPTYKGFMAIIDDPSRVSVGVSSDFKDKQPGILVSEFLEKYDAVLAVNGGAFSDPNGKGNGGYPGGVLISDGVVYHEPTQYLTTACFDRNHRLIVGNITVKQALEMDVRDAVSFGPALIINGEVTDAGKDPGLNPRTAIGQRADGAVLLLVVDGRHLDSIGASMADLISIMQEYGAINACNLDGGSSTAMVVNGTQLNDGASVVGSRRIPSAVIVR